VDVPKHTTQTATNPVYYLSSIYRLSLRRELNLNLRKPQREKRINQTEMLIK
jgi:hypothetical protein